MEISHVLRFNPSEHMWISLCGLVSDSFQIREHIEKSGNEFCTFCEYEFWQQRNGELNQMLFPPESRFCGMEKEIYLANKGISLIDKCEGNPEKITETVKRIEEAIGAIRAIYSGARRRSIQLENEMSEEGRVKLNKASNGRWSEKKKAEEILKEKALVECNSLLEEFDL